MWQMLRVICLFENVDDLTNSASVLETLFSMPAYVGAMKGKQEVIVRDSESAKDAGRLAASYALYTSQMKMTEIAAKYSIELIFFHGIWRYVGEIQHFSETFFLILREPLIHNSVSHNKDR